MELEPVDQLQVTTLVEDSVNFFLPEREGVKHRYPEQGEFLAEHGWAALIETTTGNERHTILLDAGQSATTLLHNMACLKLDPAAIEALVVSHGHDDHTGAVAEIARRAARPLPIYVHPAAFRERWYIPSDGPRRGPWRVEPDAWQQAGGRMVALDEPRRLSPGCLATGSVPRANDFERPPKDYCYRRQGDAFYPDTLPDDQAVVVAVKDKGLVVVAGCAHAGIVNTVRYAQMIAGEERVWAIAGGFHLGRASGEHIAATIAGLKAVQPTIVAPGHCTGFEALCAFAREIPDQFVLNVVGTVIYTEGVVK